MQLLSLQDWSFQAQQRSVLVLAVADANALGIALGWEWADAGSSPRFKIIIGVLTYLAMDRNHGLYWDRYQGLMIHIPGEL